MIVISKETILPMLDLIDEFNQGKDVAYELTQLLEHEDYQIEIERYNAHQEGIGFTKKDYIDFFMNIKKLSSYEGASKALRYREKDLLHIINNVDYYREVYNRIADFKEDDVRKAIKKSKVGLPDKVKLDDIRIIFSIGLGVSGGWIHKNYSHYDLKVVISEKSQLGLLNTIAHECHHIGLNKYMEHIDFDSFSDNLDAVFFLYFSGEGTAVKYCNNYRGILTKKLYINEESSVNSKSYDYFISNFDVIYKNFREDIYALLTHKITCIKEVGELFSNNYFYRDVEINGNLIENYLWQPIAYFLGAEIWGLIHDIYGREKVFELLHNPREFLLHYNEGLSIVGREDLRIVL